jgi:hypothetical protein
MRHIGAHCLGGRRRLGRAWTFRSRNCCCHNALAPPQCGGYNAQWVALGVVLVARSSRRHVW